MAKPRKVQEPTGTYETKPPAAKPASAESAVRSAKLDDVKKANDKLIRVHHEVLKKLAH